MFFVFSTLSATYYNVRVGGVHKRDHCVWRRSAETPRNTNSSNNNGVGERDHQWISDAGDVSHHRRGVYRLQRALDFKRLENEWQGEVD